MASHVAGLFNVSHFIGINDTHSGSLHV